MPDKEHPERTWRHAVDVAARLRTTLVDRDAPVDLIARIQPSSNLAGQGFVHFGSVPVEIAELFLAGIENTPAKEHTS